MTIELSEDLKRKAIKALEEAKKLQDVEIEIPETELLVVSATNAEKYRVVDAIMYEGEKFYVVQRT